MNLISFVILIVLLLGCAWFLFDKFGNCLVASLDRWIESIEVKPKGVKK